MAKLRLKHVKFLSSFSSAQHGLPETVEWGSHRCQSLCSRRHALLHLLAQLLVQQRQGGVPHQAAGVVHAVHILASNEGTQNSAQLVEVVKQPGITDSSCFRPAGKNLFSFVFLFFFSFSFFFSFVNVKLN